MDTLPSSSFSEHKMGEYDHTDGNELGEFTSMEKLKEKNECQLPMPRHG